MHGSMRRREETRPVGQPVRPRRLPPTLPPPFGLETHEIDNVHHPDPRIGEVLAQQGRRGDGL